MSVLSDLLKKNSALFGGADQNYGIKRYSLPNDAGTYSASGITPTNTSPNPVGPLPGLGQKPVYPTPTGNIPVVTSPTIKKLSTPTFTGTVPAPTSTGLDYSKYTNPATGQPYTPSEYAEVMANKAKGGVTSYAANAINNPDQSMEDLNRAGYGLNNARNDIATGATDPYGAASKSGIQYTPAELKAIEGAYAGVYDSALSDVFTKIDTKQKEAAAALNMKNELAKLAVQHKYAMAEKQAPTYADMQTAAGIGAYVPGANPTVDAWAQGIANQSIKMADVPKAYKSAVQLAVTAGGNQLNGKPTTTELGKAALLNAKALMTKINDGTGTNAVGASRLWGAGALGAAIPGTDAYGFSNDFNAIKSQLSLEAVKYLKGQGQVSDAERALLAQAATKLNLSQSEKEFKDTLQQIINKLETGNVEGTTPVGGTTTAPDGTLIEITD